MQHLAPLMDPLTRAGPLPAVRGLARRVLAVAAVAAATLFAAANAQPLPANAQAAVDRGEALMAEALATYDAQYPDKPLWQAAFREGRTAVSLAPGNPAALRFLAEAYSRANWPGPAVKTWEEYAAAGGQFDDEAAELYGKDANANAYAAYQRGDKAAAAEMYLKVTQVLPQNLEAHRWLGRIMLELRRPEQAVVAWRNYLDLNPGDKGAQYFLSLAQAQARWGIDAANDFFAGVEAYDNGDMTAARTAFASATARNPDYAEAWAWLGRVAFEQKLYADAAVSYGRALALDPGNDTYSWFKRESERLQGG
ncbi:MAG: tetratricopeptide repeat protein [Trueperaceae bacterium]|jgi:tetratricopeptide (TPR) repeat protein|nr:tetratricopeptide repeat protein [Trueperaceae bacterium]